MILVNNPSVYASTEASFKSLGLGTNTWQITNDSKCNKMTANITLTFSTCYLNEFACRNGLCIDLFKRCDGIPDCKVKYMVLNSNDYCSSILPLLNIPFTM